MIGCDIDAAVGRARQRRRSAPFPGEEGLAEALAEVVGDGRLRATTDTDRGGRRGARARRRRAAAGGRRRRPARLGRRWTPSSPTSAPACRPGTTVGGRDDAAGRHHAHPRRARAGGRHSGLRAEHDFFCVFSPERVYSGRVFARPRDLPQAAWAASAPRGEARGVELYAAFLDAEVWPMGSAEAAELAKLAETTYRDVNIALGQRVRALRRPHRHRRRPRHRRRQLAALQPHPPPRGRGRRALHPGLPALLPRAATPRRACPAPRARSTRRCPRYAVDLLGPSSAAAGRAC